MGSNMAENHPVGFQWVVEARERGAEVIHVDPRYTRTSAIATMHVPLRVGSDIAFLGGIINYIIANGREFRPYVEHYTNAATIVDETFVDTNENDGVFSGFDEAERTYDNASWQYDGMDPHPSSGQRSGGAARGESHGGHGAPLSAGKPPHRDPTLQHPRCVFQLLKKHYERYTPQMVSQVCGVSGQQFLAVAEALCRNSGAERTTAFAYAVGWTHHTTGVQCIRAAAIVQLLLGNIGRPGGGILALRGHASIQGSTDIPTLYNILPGYIPMPHAAMHDSLETFVDTVSSKTGYWGYTREYMVSLLKAYYGNAATAENDFGFAYLPRIDGDHSVYTSVVGMIGKKVRGFFIVGENPVIGNVNGGYNRKALASLDWLVVRDLFEIESASFWYNGPEIETGEAKTAEIGTEVFFLPAAAHTEKSGSFTNTQRLLQWHHQAVEPQGDARSDLWFYYHLGVRIRAKLEHSTDPRDRAILDLAWHYPTSGKHADPVADAVLREINGTDAEGKAISTYTDLKADGSTSCGCWIYAGCYKDASIKPRGVSPAPSKIGSRANGAGPGRPIDGSSTIARPPHPTARRGANGKNTFGGITMRRSGRAMTSRTSCCIRLRITFHPKVPSARRRSPVRTRSSCKPMASAGSSFRTAWKTARCPRITSRKNRPSRICSIPRVAGIPHGSFTITMAIRTIPPGTHRAANVSPS